MMRISTYASYMNLLNQTMQTKAMVDMYSYQATTGIKYADYAGYGDKAANIVNMESSLAVTQNFLANNTVLDAAAQTMDTVLENVSEMLSSFKGSLTGALSTFAELEDGAPIPSDVATTLNTLQTTAFSDMQFLTDALNQSVGGKYVFGAGSSSSPASFPYTSLSQFQSYYDGINIKYPETAEAILSQITADYSSSGDLTISQSPTATNEFVLTSTRGLPSFVVGSVLNMSGVSGAPSVMQVVGYNSSGDVIVRADPAEFATLPQTYGASSPWRLQTDSYYTGGSAQEVYRISENQTISLDVDADDPVFTKLFRSFGLIAQGNLIQTDASGNVIAGQTQIFNDLITEIDSLLQSAVDNNGRATGGRNETIGICIAKISSDYVSLNNANDMLNNVKNTLESGVYNIKNVDKTEAAAKLLLAQNSLEASYQVLSTTLNLSLLNYLK